LTYPVIQLAVTLETRPYLPVLYCFVEREGEVMIHRLPWRRFSLVWLAVFGVLLVREGSHQSAIRCCLVLGDTTTTSVKAEVDSGSDYGGGSAETDELPQSPKTNLDHSKRAADGAEEYVRLADEYNVKEEYDKALSEYRKALRIVAERYGKSALALGDINFYMGISSFRAGTYEQALTYFDKALGIYFLHKIGRGKPISARTDNEWNGLEADEADSSKSDEEDVAMMADLYYCIGMTHQYLGKDHKEKMVRMWEQSWALYQRRDYIPTAFERQLLSADDLEAYEEQRRASLILTDHALQQETIVEMLLNLSDTYTDYGRYDDARIKFQDAIFATQEMTQESGGKITLHSLFAHYTTSLRRDSVERHIDIIIHNSPATSPVARKAELFKANMPQLNADQIFKGAELLFREKLADVDASLSEHERSDDDKYQVAEYIYYIGEALVKQWKLKQGLEYVTRASNVYKAIKDDVSLSDTYYFMRQIYLSLGQYEDAMIAFDNANTIYKLESGAKDIVLNEWNEYIQNTDSDGGDGKFPVIQINIEQYLRQVSNATLTLIKPVAA
jgi:tetratricopeptide (TPR) repeat protein